MFYVHLLMLLSASLVSTSFIVCSAITNELDPVVLTAIRFGFAVIFFAPWIYFRHGFRCYPGLFFRSSMISGSLVLFFCLMFASLRYTTPLNTSVIFSLVPAISGGYSLLLLRERLQKRQLAALLIGIVGVIWVIFRGDLTLLFSLQLNYGDFLFFLGCISMGFYTPLIRLFHKTEPMEMMTFWILVTGCLWLLLYGGGRLAETDYTQISTFTWGAIAYLSIFTTIITFFLTQYAVQYLSPTKVTAYSYLYPGLVLVFDLFSGRGLPGGSVIPGVVIILGAMMVLMTGKEDKDT